MKKLLIIVFALISIFANATPPTINFIIWSVAVDTAATSQVVSFTAKFDNPPGWQPNDSLRMQAFYGPGWTIPVVFKMKASEAIALPTNPDGTTTFNFTVPADFTINQWMKLVPQSATHLPYDSVYIIPPVTTGIINPINPPSNIKIHYYNIQGMEIEKPIQGFYLWKSEIGESGKGFMEYI